jgi:hypothetical protein
VGSVSGLRPRRWPENAGNTAESSALSYKNRTITASGNLHFDMLIYKEKTCQRMQNDGNPNNMRISVNLDRQAFKPQNPQGVVSIALAALIHLVFLKNLPRWTLDLLFESKTYNLNCRTTMNFSSSILQEESLFAR